jgi:hypothetical protein
MHEPAIRPKATAYGQYGFDAGTEIFMAQYAYLSLAIGYLHGGNIWGRQDVMGVVSSGSMSVDTWSIKVGFGI